MHRWLLLHPRPPPERILSAEALPDGRRGGVTHKDGRCDTITGAKKKHRVRLLAHLISLYSTLCERAIHKVASPPWYNFELCRQSATLVHSHGNPDLCITFAHVTGALLEFEAVKISYTATISGGSFDVKIERGRERMREGVPG